MSRFRLPALAALLLAALSACGSSSSTVTTPSTTAGATTTSTAPAPTRTAYPVKVADCGGRVTTYTKAPTRVVTFDHSVAETLLSLGLGDRIVGLTAFEKPADRWSVTAAEMAKLHQINDGRGYPSKEVVYALAPDFVTGIYPSALETSDTLPKREEWEQRGVHAYLVHAGCDVSSTPTTDFADIYTDIRNVGVIFDVQDRAEVLIAQMQGRVAELQAKAKAAALPPATVWTYGGEKDAWAFDGSGLLNAIISLAGARNIFGDTTKGYVQESFETIVQRDPSVVWLTTDAGFDYATAEQMKNHLAADSRTSGLTAVLKKSYVVVSFSEVTPTPRVIDGLAKFVDGLIALQGG